MPQQSPKQPSAAAGLFDIGGIAMKYWLRRVVCSLNVLVLLTANVAIARDLAEVKKSGVLIAGTEGAYPPFNFFKGSILTGFEIELTEALAKRLGVAMEWRALGFDSLLPALNQDRFDLAVSSFGITPERQKAVDFSDPYYCSGGQIVAKPGGPRTAADLAGKVVAVQIGTTYAAAVKKLSAVKEMKTFPRDTDAQQNLISGRVDAWVTDRFVIVDVISKNPDLPLQRGELLFSERIAFAVKKGNQQLRVAVNKALADVLADGTYNAISEKYFKEDIRCR
jgi:polar amino acid transport system substrate-binding protein